MRSGPWGAVGGTGRAEVVILRWRPVAPATEAEAAHRLRTLRPRSSCSFASARSRLGLASALHSTLHHLMAAPPLSSALPPYDVNVVNEVRSRMMAVSVRRRPTDFPVRSGRSGARSTAINHKHLLWKAVDFLLLRGRRADEFRQIVQLMSGVEFAAARCWMSNEALSGRSFIWKAVDPRNSRPRVLPSKCARTTGDKVRQQLHFLLSNFREAYAAHRKRCGPALLFGVII
ncbi:unnamed protein product [Heligmosomoides polygyrus]|uniref:Uncharacterized protein n=1 Tax=Heligmosomoides polygyrus TaxID=6339 RepID=A0A183FQV1_HELPZ|nr:unnamed protein product [Heligmosomoides polygyrus]